MIFSDWLCGFPWKILQGSTDVYVADVCYDSRKAAPDTVFVCMKGSVRDSHDFIPDILSAGCRVLVVEDGWSIPEAFPADVTVVSTPNGRQALAYLAAARFGHPAEKMITIGVTGTKGKTTTTHMIRAILETCGKKVGMIGTNGVTIADETYPTRNTTPESYELQQYFAKMVEKGCEYMVMEVSSQGVKMHRIDGIFFQYAVFTNISPDHIGPNEHADFDEYLHCKAELFSRCRIGIFNLDDAHSREMMQGARCKSYTFSLKQDADFQAGTISYLHEPGFVGLEFPVTVKTDTRKTLSLRVGIPGKFNAYNALAAYSVCSFFDLDDEKIQEALCQVRVNGRMEIVHSCHKYSVLVDYAHNAVSMESLLETLRDYHPKRLVCVFGCGGNRAKDRRYSMGEIGGRMADLCIVTADNSRFEKVEDIIEDIKVGLHRTNGNYIVVPDRREAIFYSIRQAEPGDMIAVIGKGHEDYQEIEGVRYPFLDRAVILEAVKGMKNDGKHDGEKDC
ncbi:MAG: UDP-N-acetylmuramoyl-L-alanyl-D-glutamate--2,6-diaminopimelate ligase [bacterium]|nr:UDP-N-acetylmuramoyl-L-alanyl-D-glutamate--2,6-diaminopimelate ligase [bacterium]